MNKVEQCIEQVKAQKYSDKVAAMVAEHSVNEGRRWFINGEQHLFVDPNTFQISEVTAGQVPFGAPLVDLTEAAKESPVTESAPTPQATPTTETASDVTTNVTEAVDTSQMPAAMQAAIDAKKKKKKGEPEPDPKDPDEPAEKKRSEESLRTGFVSELQSLTESTFDANAHEVDVTLIRTGWSANGKYYSREALGKAVPAFEGARAYVNHPTVTEGRERPERDVRDLAGYYKNVRQADDGSLRGTLKLIGRNGDDLMPLVQEAVTNKPDLLGLSINVLARTKQGEVDGRKGILVEEIAQARSTSTDIVTTPAAGGKFERVTASGDELTSDLLKAMEYDEWREARPDFAARMKNEMRTARKEELTEAAVLEASQLREQLDAKDKALAELQEAKAQTEKALADMRAETTQRESALLAERKLTESKLPETWTKELKPQLIGKSDAEMDKTIEAERKKYFSVKQPIRVIEAGGQPLTGETFVRTEQVAVSESLGVDATKAPLDWESPEQWAIRTGKRR